MLPKADNALVEREKITEYLLSTVHPSGRTKARFFLSFGFRADSWEYLAESLRLQAVINDIAEIEESDFGPRYCIDGTIETPDGRSPFARTVWQFDLGSDHPRLLTAFPRRR